MKIFSKIGRAWEMLQAIFCRYFGRDYVCGCGHTAKWKNLITIHGCCRVFTAPSENPTYCLECFAKAAIRCAWCGATIDPGDAITLYTPMAEFKIPEYAVVYKREPHLQLVGCLGWNCADSGIDRAGFWVMPGKVQRALSPLEIIMAQEVKQPILIRDLSDPREAVLISEEMYPPENGNGSAKK